MQTDQLNPAVLEITNNQQKVTIIPTKINADSSSLSSDLEEIIEKIGSNGIFQKMIVFSFSLFYCSFSGFLLSPSFFIPQPHFQCIGNPNLSTEETDGCQQHCTEISPDNKMTITKQFSLSCDNKSIRLAMVSLIYGGCALGNAIMCAVSECIGRQKTLLICIFSGIFCLAGVIQSSTYYELIIFNSLTAFFFEPIASLIFVYVSEISAGKYRQYYFTMIMLSWALGEIILGGVAYYEIHWVKAYSHLYLMPNIIVFGLIALFIIETPHFLIAQGKIQEAKNVLEIIASRNKTINKNNNRQSIDRFIEQIKKLQPKNKDNQDDHNQTQENHQISPTNDTETITNKNKHDPQEFHEKSTQPRILQVRLHHIVRLPNLRKLVLSSSGVFFATNLIYFGSSLSLEEIGSNIYLSQIYLGIVEGVTMIVSNFVILKCKRRWLLFILHSICCLLCLSFLFISSETAKMIVALFTRIFNTLVIAILNVYLNELFPTPARSLCVGLSTLGGLASVTITPFIIEWTLLIGINQVAFIGILAFLGCFCCYGLRETKGKPLQSELDPEDFIQLKNIYERKILKRKEKQGM